jgi:hypothetical protein
LALRFDAAPGPGGGSFISFVIPAININGVGVFNSTINGSPSGSSEGIFRSDGSGPISLFRTLQNAPGTGGGQFSDFNNNPAINSAGQVAIFSNLTATSDASTNGVFRTGDGINFTAIARDKLSAPGGGAYLALGAPQINSSGQVMFFSTLAGTADGSTTGIFRSDGVTPTLLARDKQTAPGPGGGTFNTLTLTTPPAFNDLGQTAFSASVVGGTNTQGVFRSDGTAIAIARGVQPAPGGGTWNNFSQPDMNSRGDVVFTSLISGAADGAVAGIFRSDGITPAAIVRTNQPAPGGGTFTNLNNSPTVNSAGQVVFSAVFNNSPDGATDGIFRGDGGAVEVIARANQPAPGGGGGVYSSFSTPTMNNAGAVAFFASLTGTSGGSSDDSAIYLADPQETIVVAREGQSAFGSTIFVASFAGGQNKGSRGPLNDFGQIALNLTLNNGNQMSVRFTPEIHFRNASGGNWDTNTNWTVGIKPAAVHNTFVDPPAPFGATVNGPSNDVTVKSLTVSGRNGGNAQLNLNGGGNLTVTNAITIASNGAITLQNGTLTGQSITVGGALTESVGASIVGTSLINNNYTSLSGNATISGPVENNAQMGLTNGALLSASGGVTNYTNLSFENSTITGNVTNSFGASMSGRGTITGTLNNQGNLYLSGLLSLSGALSNNGSINLNLAQNLRLSASSTNAGTITLFGGALTPNGAVQMDNNAGGLIQGGGAISINLRNVAGTINSNGTQPLVISNLLGNLAGAQIRVADGSSLTINSPFTNNGLINLAGGSATISGLTITNAGNIRGAGTVGNAVNNSGTLHAEGGLLTLMGTPNNNTSTAQIQVEDDATLIYTQGLATNGGTIALTGGNFDNNNLAMNNTGRITGWGGYSASTLTNNGTVTFTGGFTTINGTVINSATRQIRVAYNPALFTGNVTNSGIFKNTATTITFAGTYTENGTFISDPADNFFSSVMIGEQGAWVGGVGDRFFVSGDLISRSGNKSGWQTSDAQLSLIGGIEHLLSVAGVDRGRSFDGYIDNFAWGALVVGAGDRLKLEDANGEDGGALYVHSLLLAGGLDQISNITGDGLSIYYDLREPANAFLGGQSYALAGGGQIAPVPEPAAGMLGLVGLTLLNRRRKRGR